MLGGWGGVGGGMDPYL